MICLACAINTDQGHFGECHLTACSGNATKTWCDCQHKEGRLTENEAKHAGSKDSGASSITPG